MKTCTQCNKRKPLDAFHVDNRASDARRSECKACKLKAERAPDYRERDRGRRRTPERREWYRDYMKTPEAKLRRAARVAVMNAIRAGKLIRPSSCSRCGGGGGIEGHHPDYTKPLAVVWLCKPCHQAEHQQTETL